MRYTRSCKYQDLPAFFVPHLPEKCYILFAVLDDWRSLVLFAIATQSL
ncbi:hypothetical protein [Microcoleus sp. CAWBG58]|nr:hypothetical protein [Microcoleus sp. CAWBG58]